MKKRYLIMAVSAVVLTAVLTAGAQQMGGLRQHYAHGFLMRHLINELNLSTDQRAAIKQILVEERPGLQELAKKAQQQRNELRSLSTFDEEKVRSIAQANSSTYVDFVVERERIRSRIFAVLTPAQQAKVKQLSDEFHQGMQERLSQLGENL
jgi:Spy/CpxP family protein refolding chaperone